MNKRLEDFLPKVPAEALQGPLHVDATHKKIEPEEQELIRKLQDDARNRKKVSGTATQ